MTYRPRNKRKINKTAAIIIVVLLVLFFFGPSVKGITQWFANPIISTKNAIVYPFKNSVEYFNTKQNLINENEELKEENRRLRIENLTVNSLKEENASLKEIVAFEDADKNLFVAKVISQPPFSPYDTFIVDLGSNEAEVGDKVFYSNVLLGEIEEVYRRNAVIRLYSSANQTISINLIDQQFEASGIGGNGFLIRLPKDIEIPENEIVFVERTPIGQIDEVINDQTGAFQNIYFRYPFNINNIDFVQIEDN